ncbi:MAG: MFS transporter [Candidatus Hodarchaeales archaeon]
MTESDNSGAKSETNLKGYLFFLVGQWISILGSNIVQFGLIWFITIETNSPAILGMAAFFGMAPFYIVTPIAGVFIDRWSRKKVIILVDFMQAMLTLILIVFFIYYTIIFSILELIIAILLISTLRGIFGAFHTSAVDTLLPIMVPRKHLSRINGINYLATGAINIVGPIVGAIALSLVEMKNLLWLDVITFLVAVFPTMVVFIPIIKKTTQEVSKQSFKKEISEGMSFIRETTGLFYLLVVFTGVNFFMAPIFTQFPLLVQSIHLGDEGTLALLLSINQVGLICGSFIMSSWKGFSNNAKGVALGIFFTYLGLLTIAIAPIGNFLVVGLGFCINGFTLPIMNVSSETIWSKTVPKNLLGRVYAVRRTVAQFSFPISTILGGFLAEIFGLIPILATCAVLGIVLLGYSWFFTPLSKVEQSIEESLTNKSAIHNSDHQD